MKKIFLQLAGLLLACLLFIPSALAQNRALESYFAGHGLSVTKPLWQKMELLNKEQKFLYLGQDYVLNNWSAALILEFEQAEEWEAVVQIIAPDGQQFFYHQASQVLLDNAQKGQYTMRLEKSLTNALGLNIYSAYPSLPLNQPLILTADVENYLNLQTNVEEHLRNGGTIINIGSQQINGWVQAIVWQLEMVSLEGESATISKFSDYYFYIPEELFINESQATRVVEYLKEELNKGIDLQKIGLLILILLATVILQKQCKKIFVQISKNFLKNIAVTLSASIIFLIILSVIALHLYQNYSGLDLFPNFKISDFLEQWNIQMIVLVLMAVALAILLFSLKGIKSALLAIILLAAIGLTAWPSQNEIRPREELKTILTNQTTFPVSSDKEVKGVLTVRSKNEQFTNKSFYLNLLDESGNVIASQFFSLSQQLLGSKSREQQLQFVFPVAAGNYELQLENADPSKDGDYELINIQLEAS